MRRTFLILGLLFSAVSFAMLPEFCVRAVEILADHSAIYAGCESGQCTRNIRRALEALAGSGGKFDVSKARVLFIRKVEPLRGTLINASHVRGSQGPGNEKFGHHTVMMLDYGDGHIVDLDFGRGNETPTVRNYFQRMFPNEINNLAVGVMSAKDFMASYPAKDVRDESPLYDEEADRWNARYNQVSYQPLTEWLKLLPPPK